MDKPIKTYEDLLKEKESLKHKIAVQKGGLKYNISGIKNALKPAQSAVGFLGKFTGKKSGNPILTFVTKMATAFILGKIIKKKKGGIIRKIAALFLANFITLSVRPVITSLNQFLLRKIRPSHRSETLPAETITAKQPY